MKAEDERDESGEEVKQNLEVSKADIFKILDDYFFISSDSDIFILNKDDEYSRRLSSNEIENLPVRVIWVGPASQTRYVADDFNAVKALVKIVDKFNKMVPNPSFHGFVLTSLVTHLRALLYEQIIENQRFFYTILTLSGDQHGTGKSLMFSVNQSLLYGHEISSDRHISAGSLFRKLAGKGDDGKVPVYGNL